MQDRYARHDAIRELKKALADRLIGSKIDQIVEEISVEYIEEIVLSKVSLRIDSILRDKKTQLEKIVYQVLVEGEIYNKIESMIDKTLVSDMINKIIYRGITER